MIAVTVTAHCIGRCDWTATGDWPAVDRAAEKHTKAGHPTATVAAAPGADHGQASRAVTTTPPGHQ